MKIRCCALGSPGGWGERSPRRLIRRLGPFALGNENPLDLA